VDLNYDAGYLMGIVWKFLIFMLVKGIRVIQYYI